MGVTPTFVPWKARPAATACDHQCGAQNQVKGEAVVLGFPFPVPAASRL
jgi:hypothetical protein